MFDDNADARSDISQCSRGSRGSTSREESETRLQQIKASPCCWYNGTKKKTPLSLSVCVFPSPSNILCWDDGQNVGCKQHAGAACDVIWQISFRTNAKSGPKIVSSFSLFFFFSFCLVFVKPGDMGIELEWKKKKDFRIFESRSRRFCAPISDPVTTQTVYTCEKPIFDPTRV